MRTSQYLLLFDLLIKYEIDKFNFILDILSRLKNILILADIIKVLDAFYINIEEEIYAKAFDD